MPGMFPSCDFGSLRPFEVVLHQPAGSELPTVFSFLRSIDLIDHLVEGIYRVDIRPSVEFPFISFPLIDIYHRNLTLLFRVLFLYSETPVTFSLFLCYDPLLPPDLDVLTPCCVLPCREVPALIFGLVALFLFLLPFPPVFLHRSTTLAKMKRV